MTGAGSAVEFHAPTRILIEEGGRARIGAHLARLRAGRVLLVTDQGVQRSGLLVAVRASLQAAGLEFEEFADLHANPRTSECEALVQRYRGRGIGIVLAVGGGSAIDVAKAASLLLVHGGQVADYLQGRPGDTPLLPIACIPTTAGTGSEVTQYAVISDTQRRQKLCLVDPALVPALAVLDAEVLATLPAPVIASTGLDALTHAIEAYTCRRANPVSDALALHAIVLAGRHLEAAANGLPGEHRRRMLVASTLAGLAFGNADVAAVHCLSEALGGYYDWPHGVCNAILLPHVFRYNALADPVRHAAVAHALGIEPSPDPAATAEAGAAALASLVVRLRIPTLGALAGDAMARFRADVPALAAAAKANVSDASNVRALAPSDYAQLLTVAANL